MKLINVITTTAKKFLAFAKNNPIYLVTSATIGTAFSLAAIIFFNAFRRNYINQEEIVNLLTQEKNLLYKRLTDAIIANSVYDVQIVLETIKKHAPEYIHSFVNACLVKNYKELFANDFPLLIAARHGYCEIAMILIDAGADIEKEKPLSKGVTALYSAANHGKLEMLKLLINLHANINVSSKDGITPLMVASAEGHLPCVQFLIDSGANVNIFTYDGVSALYIAAQNGYKEIVEALLSAGADKEATATQYKLTPLWTASAGGHLTIVKKLIEAGADINRETGDGSPLYIAAWNGHFPIVQQLLEANANPYSDLDVACAIYAAVKNNHIAVVELLLDVGAGIHARTPFLSDKIQTKNKLVIGLRFLLNEQLTIVTKSTAGFEQAITTVKEFDNALCDGIVFNLPEIIRTCDCLLEFLKKQLVIKDISNQARDYIFVVNSTVQEIKEIAINHHQQIIRRNQFIEKILLLAYDKENQKSQSLWSCLPKEMMILIIHMINFRSDESIGKTPDQIRHYTRFIFENSADVYKILSQKHGVKIKEKNPQIQNKFCFFYSTNNEISSQENVELKAIYRSNKL